MEVRREDGESDSLLTRTQEEAAASGCGDDEDAVGGGAGRRDTAQRPWTVHSGKAPWLCSGAA
jgi:hypothetical protein